MAKKILSGIVAILVILVIVIITRPDDFKVTRSMSMNVPVDVVFANVNNFHKWEAWSPWGKLDPNAKTSYEGPTDGVGATFKWAGNEQVGEGSQTIMVSQPNQLIQIKLEFIKPFPGINTSEFHFAPQGNQTLVTWSMYGKNNFMSKAMSLFMDCDKFVGAQFATGLTSLKNIVEKK